MFGILKNLFFRISSNIKNSNIKDMVSIFKYFEYLFFVFCSYLEIIIKFKILVKMLSI